ncbi:unnamed protein product [Diamesa tonsa]
MNTVFIISLVLFSVLTVNAKVFLRCELAKTFSENGVPRTFISNWVCLSEAESNSNTSKVERYPNLSSSFGIFQINSKLWCREGRKGGLCNKRCEDFLDDAIRDDIECAKKIYEKEGFKNWKRWEVNVVVILCMTLLSDAKIFKRCELAKELSQNTLIERSFISHWVCLIESESGAETSKVQEYPNLSTSYGIFQINSKEWCRKGRKGGECGMKCEDFLNEDIKDDIKCAKVIYNRNGFKGWKEWSSRCKNRPLPDVSKCSYSQVQF